MKRTKTRVRTCKFCNKDYIAKNEHQKMCKTCKRIYSIEYQRLYHYLRKDKLEKKDIGYLNCPFCFKFIIGRRVCQDCTNLRHKICETLIEELGLQKTVIR